MSDKPIAAPAGLARRAFVTAIAGGAAAAIVAPAASLASGETDPIFELIEAHRTAERALSAACAEQSRREQILIDEGTGLCPFATVADRVAGGRPQVCYTHEQIDGYGQSAGEQGRARAHADLDTALERQRKVLGNIENETWEAGEAGTAAFDDLVWTVPTSLAGIRALLFYLTEDVDGLDGNFQDGKIEALLSSIKEALEAIYPAV